MSTSSVRDVDAVGLQAPHELLGPMGVEPDPVEADEPLDVGVAGLPRRPGPAGLPGRQQRSVHPPRRVRAAGRRARAAAASGQPERWRTGPASPPTPPPPRSAWPAARSSSTSEVSAAAVGHPTDLHLEDVPGRGRRRHRARLGRGLQQAVPQRSELQEVEQLADLVGRPSRPSGGPSTSTSTGTSRTSGVARALTRTWASCSARLARNFGVSWSRLANMPSRSP